jgi:hypothetical protein
MMSTTPTIMTTVKQSPVDAKNFKLGGSSNSSIGDFMSSFIVSFLIQADPPKRLDKALSRDVPEEADISRSQIVRFLEKVQ